MKHVMPAYPPGTLTLNQTMSEAGEIFDHSDSCYRLLVIGRHWALIDRGKILAQDYNAADYSTAKQAGLMSARVYVPHFGMDSVVTRASHELLVAAKPTDEESFKEWLRSHHQEVVNGFLQTLEGNLGKYKLEDLVAFGRGAYARQKG